MPRTLSPRPPVFRTAPGVHPPDPYAPRIAARIAVPRGARVLDLGCGTGLYGLWAAQRGAAETWLLDVDPAAVACARANADANRLPHVHVAVGDFFAPCAGARFDVIIGNVPQTPAPCNFSTAKWGGRDGTAFLRRLAREAPRHLRPGGRLYFLLIDLTDAARVRAAFARRFTLSCRLRLTRTCTPAEYEARQPGLWSYLARLRAAGRIRFQAPRPGRAGPYRFAIRLYVARLRPARAATPRSP